MDELIHHLFHRRHFWRHAKISELSELYISLMLRVLGLSLIGIFIPVYLYQAGFTLSTIALFYILYHLLRLGLDPITGYLVSKYGPKHIIRFSYFIQIFYLVSVIAVGNGYAPLWVLLLSFVFTASFFFVPFEVDFSTIQKAKKIGSEISGLSIIQQIAGALGPLAGGLIASIYSFELAVFIAMFITLLAALPLMMTGEPTKKNNFAYSFKLSSYKTVLSHRNLVYIGHGANIIASNIIWPLFVAIVIFSTQVYIGVGLVKAISLAVGIAGSYVVGRLVDNKRGRDLLRISTVINAGTYLIRPFTQTALGAIAISTVAEPLYTGTYIPLNKGLYDEIDSDKEGRVAKAINVLASLHIGRLIGWSAILFATIYLSDTNALRIGLLVLGLMSLLILTEKFKALNK